MLLMLIPNGTPLVLVALLVVIESISYVARSLSLKLKLSANLLSGHALLIILSTFIISFNSKVMIMLSLVGITLLFFMEVFLSILQAYVFSVLMYSLPWIVVYLV